MTQTHNNRLSDNYKKDKMMIDFCINCIRKGTGFCVSCLHRKRTYENKILNLVGEKK
jgi:hypothetical protein